MMLFSGLLACGTPTYEAVRETVYNHRGQIDACYDQRLKVNPKVAGQVDFGWTLDAGVVTATKVTNDTTGDPELAKCIETKLRKWKFPPEASGDVTWPFSFATTP